MVRGTTRDPQRLPAIEAAGIEPALADPDRAATLVELIADVTLIYWLLGSAAGNEDAVASVHGPRLERLCEEIVDTPVRGLVYEGAGGIDDAHLRRGEAIVAAAGERWRIPFEVIRQAPDDLGAWRAEMVAAARRLTG